MQLPNSLGNKSIYDKSYLQQLWLKFIQNERPKEIERSKVNVSV